MYGYAPCRKFLREAAQDPCRARALEPSEHSRLDPAASLAPAPIAPERPGQMPWRPRNPMRARAPAACVFHGLALRRGVSEYPPCASGFWGPQPVGFHQRVGCELELSHGRNKGNLCGFPGLAELGALGLEARAAAHCDDGRHAERIPQRLAAPADEGPAFPLAGSAAEGGRACLPPGFPIPGRKVGISPVATGPRPGMEHGISR